MDDQTKEIFKQTGNDLPENGLELTLPRLILGGYRQFNLGSKGINFAAELDIDITTDRKRNVLIRFNPFSIDPHMGVAIGYKKYVQVRMGINNIQYVKNFDDSQSLNVQPNIGVGLNIKKFSLDYAFTDLGDASAALYSHVISLRIRLNKPRNALK